MTYKSQNFSKIRQKSPQKPENRQKNRLCDEFCWVLGSNRRSKTRSLSAQIRRLQPFEKCHKSQTKSAKRNLCVGYQNTKMVSSLNCNKLTGSPLVCAADGRLTLVGIAKGRGDCESKVVLETHGTISNNMQWITKTVEENN